jgi:hypothetical protein
MIQLCAMMLVLIAGAVQGQDNKKKPYMIGEDGPVTERGSTRVLYWSPQKDMALGEFAINYGRPVWKKDYEDSAKFDSGTKGKIWRLGKDYWTTLDTNIPLKVGGKDVAVGQYYLGLARSKDGATWSLAFLDPSKIRSMKLDAFEIERAPILFQVPVSSEPATTASEKLTILLSYPKDNPKNVTMKIAWGKLQVSVPIQATVN